MTTLLIILSGLISILATLPYLIEIIRGNTKPRIVTWITWTILTAIASAASFTDHQYPAGCLLLCAAIAAASIVIFGFKHGDRKFGRLDAICQITALLGLVLWLVFNSPGIAVIITISIDLIGCIPTIWHSWQKPHEETWITFLLSGIGGGLIVFAASSWRATAIAYPLYLLIINLLMTAILLYSPHRQVHAIRVGTTGDEG